jgi:hypothetical protein
MWLQARIESMQTKAYIQIFKTSVKLVLGFARIGKQPTLEGFKKHLQRQAVQVIELRGELFVLDDYDEAIARISRHPSGGFEIKEL